MELLQVKKKEAEEEENKNVGQVYGANIVQREKEKENVFSILFSISIIQRKRKARPFSFYFFNFFLLHTNDEPWRVFCRYTLAKEVGL